MTLKQRIEDAVKAIGATAAPEFGIILGTGLGGLNPAYAKGDLMLIDDHINLMGTNPLIGPNDESLGPRFPDLCRPYDAEFLKLAESIAKEEKISVRRGVYVALTGP